MKIYVISLAAGVLVGVIYGLLQVRSPAPPLVALVGLLGILVGEQMPPLVKTYWHRQGQATAWLHEQVGPHMCGQLPTAQNAGNKDKATEKSS
ncbi:XapX domain-containing protein [Dyella sp. C11]|uniref:XapX domain-containing protein n=1 Tax=Dyella sp. C11 TaxID=2126991 RepID=UPI000D65E9E4|nr:XapX domain-containing protein [Dyella sp. C11]